MGLPADRRAEPPYLPPRPRTCKECVFVIELVYYDLKNYMCGLSPKAVRINNRVDVPCQYGVRK